MAFEVICNLEVPDLGRLAVVSHGMVEVSYNLTSDKQSRWLKVPYLSLRRDEDIRLQLFRIWPPCLKVVEARHFRANDVLWVIGFLDQPHSSGRGVQFLDLSGSKLPKDDSLGLYIHASLNLRQLILCNCHIDRHHLQHLNWGLLHEPHFGRLDPTRSLEYINLRANKIEKDAAPFLANLIRHLPLKRLVLSENNLLDAGVEVLLPALRVNQTLLDLDMSQNCFTALGVVGLIEVLETNTTLRMLNVGGHPLVGDMRNEELASALGKATGLKELHLWGCGLQDAAFEAIMGSKPFGMRLNLASNHLSFDLQMRLLHLEKTSQAFAETLGQLQL